MAAQLRPVLLHHCGQKVDVPYRVTNMQSQVDQGQRRVTLLVRDQSGRTQVSEINECVENHSPKALQPVFWQLVGEGPRSELREHDRA